MIQDSSSLLGHVHSLSVCNEPLSSAKSSSLSLIANEKQQTSALLHFLMVALLLTGINHLIIESDTALTPYH